MAQQPAGSQGVSPRPDVSARGSGRPRGWVEAFAQRETRRRRRTHAQVWTSRLAVIVIVIGIWQALSSLHIVKQILISNPDLVGKDLGHWVTTSSFWTDLRVTLTEMILGLAIGTAIGVIVGIAVGIRPRLSRAVQPLTVAVHAVPIAVMVPLFLLWFGFGQTPKVVIVALSVFFVMFFNTLAGMGEVNRAQILGLRMMGCGPTTILREIYLPSVLAWVVVAFRSAISFALVGAVVSEFLAADQGLGYAMQNATQLLNVPRVFSVLIVLALLGGLLSGVVDLVERWALRWR